jgi:hypothetical protein
MSGSVRYGLLGLGVVTLVLSAARPSFATSLTVPEIDGGTVSVGLAALAAGALMLRARVRK